MRAPDGVRARLAVRAGVRAADGLPRVGREAAAARPRARRARAADRRRRGRQARVSTPAWVYLLRCADGSLYTGWTVDVDRRLQAHRNGASRYTRTRLPIELAASFPMATPAPPAARRPASSGSPGARSRP